MTDQQAFDNAMHCGDFHDASELAERMNNDLIPRTPELNRLKDFLAMVAARPNHEWAVAELKDFYTPKVPFTEEKLLLASRARGSVRALFRDWSDP